MEPDRFFVLRDCQPDETEAVLALWRQAETTVSPTDTVEDLSRAITASPAVVLVAEAQGQIVGSVIGSFDGWRGNIYRLAVHPDFRRHGIARALVREVEQCLVASRRRAHHSVGRTGAPVGHGVLARHRLRD